MLYIFWDVVLHKRHADTVKFNSRHSEVQNWPKLNHLWQSHYDCQRTCRLFADSFRPTKEKDIWRIKLIWKLPLRMFNGIKLLFEWTKIPRKSMKTHTHITHFRRYSSVLRWKIKCRVWIKTVHTKCGKECLEDIDCVLYANSYVV